MAKSKKSKELEEALADQKWWQENVGNPLGLRLCGWSYRHQATFLQVNTGHTIQISRWFADIIIAITT